MTKPRLQEKSLIKKLKNSYCSQRVPSVVGHC